MNQLLAILTRSLFWAISDEAAAHLIACAFHPATAGLNASLSPFPGAWEAAAPSMRTNANGRSKTAVIPVQGILTKDGPAWLGSNYDKLSDAMDKAVNDPDVNRIVLAVDSPGGEVTGLPEVGGVFRAAALAKPVSAIVEGQSLSAAYWLTSQARDITVTPSGDVGSVGVRTMHADISRMLDKDGVTITELYSGNHKTEWSPYAPLSDETKAHVQGRLAAKHAEFINAVQEGRGNRLTEDIVKARFGEGRMLTANDALNAGMVDKVQSARDFYKALTPVTEQETSAPAFPVRAWHELNRARAGH